MMVARFAGGPEDPVSGTAPASLLPLIAIYRSERHRSYKAELDRPTGEGDGKL